MTKLKSKVRRTGSLNSQYYFHFRFFLFKGIIFINIDFKDDTFNFISNNFTILE
jgi:hypothetical protein